MWFLYSLYFAIWSAYSTYFVKKNTDKISYIPLMFILISCGLPFIFVLVLLTGGIPHVTPQFYFLMLCAGVIDTIAFYSFFSAIDKSEVSLVAPLASLGPVFTTIIAIFALGETPKATGALGILLIVVGIYILNLSDFKKGILTPFKTLFAHSGTWLFLLATLIWAITPILQKSAILETSPQIPLYASFWGMIFVTIFTGIFAAKKAAGNLQFIKKNIKSIVIFEAGSALAQLAAFTAFTLSLVAYSTAIFRTSSFFIVIFGVLFLKEKRGKEKMIGASVMVAGAILLVL